MFFLAYSIFRGHPTREPASSRVTYFIMRAYTGTGVSHSQHRKTFGWGFGKNAGEWTGSVEIRKKSLAVSVACMAIYWPTPGLKGRTFKLCVLTRSDFNFCVRSSPLRGSRSKWVLTETKSWQDLDLLILNFWWTLFNPCCVQTVENHLVKTEETHVLQRKDQSLHPTFVFHCQCQHSVTLNTSRKCGKTWSQPQVSTINVFHWKKNWNMRQSF